MTTIPLNYASANQLVEQYIGTAYENVRKVSDNINLITPVASALDNIIQLSEVTNEIETLVTFQGAIETIAPEINSVIAVGNVIDNIDTVANIESQIDAVVLNQTSIQNVSDNILNINILSGIDDEITLVANTVPNINSLINNLNSINLTANNITDISTVATNISNVDTLAVLDSEISFLVNNFGDVQNAANIVRPWETDLNLELNTAPEVTGINYNSLDSCINYALPRLQVGGTLTILMPENTTINETVPLDPGKFEHINLVITGSTSLTSVLNLFSPVTFSNDKVRLSNLTWSNQGGNGFSSSDGFSKCLQVTMENCVLPRMELTNVDNTIITGSSITSGNAPFALRLDSCSGSITNCSFSVGVSFGSMTCLIFDNQSNFTNTGNSYTKVFGPGNMTALLAQKNSQIVSENDIFDGTEATQYSPNPNTYNNFYSRIITVA